MKMTTVLMAAALAIAVVHEAGLTVLPSSVQEAQENPCNVEEQGGGPYGDVDLDLDCEFDGSSEIGEGEESNGPPPPGED
jgi:hypothetical protein